MYEKRRKRIIIILLVMSVVCVWGYISVNKGLYIKRNCKANVYRISQENYDEQKAILKEQNYEPEGDWEIIIDGGANYAGDDASEYCKVSVGFDVVNCSLLEYMVKDVAVSYEETEKTAYIDVDIVAYECVGAFSSSRIYACDFDMNIRYDDIDAIKEELSKYTVYLYASNYFNDSIVYECKVNADDITIEKCD